MSLLRSPVCTHRRSEENRGLSALVSRCRCPCSVLSLEENPPPPQRGVCVSAAGCRHSRYYRILGGAEHRACGRSGASGSGETQGWSCSVNSAGSIASECCGSGPRWGLISQNHLDVCSTRMRIQSASRSVTEQAWASLSVGSSSQNFLLKITTNDR